MSKASLERMEKRHARTRVYIMEAALEAFSELGVQRVSIGEIASRAGYSKASLYYYFESKEDILTAIARRGWGVLMDAALSGRARGDPLENIIESIKAQVAAFETNRRLLEFIFKLSRTTLLPDKAKGRIKERLSYIDFHLKLIKEGQAKGRIVSHISPYLLFSALAGMIIGMNGLVGFVPVGDALGEKDIDYVVRRVLSPA